MSNEQITWIFYFSYVLCIAIKAVQIYFLDSFIKPNQYNKPVIQFTSQVYEFTFGFIGLMNNIQQLSESFKTFKDEK